MTFYTTGFRKSNPRTKPRVNRRRSARRDSYARGAVFREFRARDARALDHGGFLDREPCDQPVRLGDVAAQVVDDVGRRALDHWLREAARTEGEEHQVALEIAREIAGMIGVAWTDLFPREAA